METTMMGVIYGLGFRLSGLRKWRVQSVAFRSEGLQSA